MNGIAVRGRDQVMLKVTVAEVRRDIIKQLGIDLSGTLNYGTAVVNFNTINPFSAIGGRSAAAFCRPRSPSVSATIARDGPRRRHSHFGRTESDRNLRRNGDILSPAANSRFPTGCPATPPDRRRLCQPQITFKKFGVSLVFTPVVLSEGRISLKVMTEVSDLSTENAMTLQVPARAVTDRSLDPDPPRRNDRRNSVRRFAGPGRHDPGADETSDQRLSRADAGSDSRHAVQKPRLHQPPDRTDGACDAVLVRAVAQKATVAAG